MKSYFLGICAGLLTVVLYAQPIFAAEQSEKRNPGLWVKESTFLQVHTGCLQVWNCTPKEDVLHREDMSVSTTSPGKTTGVCNAGSGAIDSCNVCAASAPKEACEWWLVKR